MKSSVRALFLALPLLALAPACSVAQHTTEAPQLADGPQTTASGHPAAPLLTNQSILKMYKAGLGNELILQTINTQPGQYDTDADSLIQLKAEGLPETILQAMIAGHRRQLTPVHEIEVSPVNEPGVYFKDRDGRWQLMETEVVHIKSGGFIKSTITDGIIKQDRNGHLNGRESKLLLQRPIQVLIYTPEGVVPTEYNFLRFRLNSSSREFRSLTGGVFHSSSGAERDEVPFTPKRTAPHTYEFTVGTDTPGGEYGILPPGTGNVTNGGKIYTFAISE
jgi:hypothetical protein